jgi:hypothetical protein
MGRRQARGGEIGARLDKVARQIQIAIAAGGTVAIYLTLPLFHDPLVIFLDVSIVSVNHWVVDIGLSCRVARRSWLFIVGVLSAGLMGFLWMMPTPDGTMIRMNSVLICARVGLGFVHFLYSGGLPGIRMGVWHFSDPLVRATIGRSLFA